MKTFLHANLTVVVEKSVAVCDINNNGEHWFMNERKKSEELQELLGLEPVSLMIKRSKLRWFGYVEQKDDNDWVRR